MEESVLTSVVLPASLFIIMLGMGMGPRSVPSGGTKTGAVTRLRQLTWHRDGLGS